MMSVKQAFWALSLLALGFGLGQVDWTVLTTAVAQDQEMPSEEATKKIVAANEALKAAIEALKTDGLYTPATKSPNPFAVLTGGINAVDDLERGRGVDPSTFAALYADDASEDVKQYLGKDDEGRLTYKNKVVKLYPVSRLKKLDIRRQVLLGEIKAERSKP